MATRIILLIFISGMTASPDVALCQESKHITLVKSSVSGAAATAAEKFETWTKQERQRVDKEKEKPTALEESLMHQLKMGMYVTDDAISSVVNAWVDYEFEGFQKMKRANTSDAKSVFPQSKRIIDVIMPFLYNRSNLQAKLYELKAQFFRAEGDSINEAKQYQSSLGLLTLLQIDIDKRRLENSLFLAVTLHHKLGNKKEAEATYLKVLAYPFWQVEGGHFGEFKNIYTRAGNGLINLRRGDLKALYSTFFVPSTMDVLGTSLAEAIRATGGDPSKHRGINPPLPKGLPPGTDAILQTQPAESNLVPGTENDERRK